MKVELYFDKNSVTSTEREFRCEKGTILKIIKSPWKIIGNKVFINQISRYGQIVKVPYLIYKSGKLIGSAGQEDLEFNPIKK